MNALYSVIVPVSALQAANQAAHVAGVDPQGLLATMSVPLVPVTGADDAAPTHMACHGQLTPEQVSVLAQSEIFPITIWFRQHLITRALEGTSAGFESHIGQRWSWEQSLEAAALKRQQLPWPNQE